MVVGPGELKRDSRYSFVLKIFSEKDFNKPIYRVFNFNGGYVGLLYRKGTGGITILFFFILLLCKEDFSTCVSFVLLQNSFQMYLFYV